MARTMGEVLPRSFPDLFGSVYGAKACDSDASVGDGIANADGKNRKNHRHRVLFVDVGSGYGTLCHAAVAKFGCVASLGIEKYREPLVKSDALMSSLDDVTKSKIKIVHADVADCDLLKLLASAPAHDAVLLFCNNLAMPPGARDRQARQFAAAQRGHAARVVVASAVPLAAGFGDDAGRESSFAVVGGGGGDGVDGGDGGAGGGRLRSPSDHASHPLRRSIGIAMTFNDCHEVRVYEDGNSEEKESKGAVGGRQEGEGWVDDDDGVGVDNGE